MLLKDFLVILILLARSCIGVELISSAIGIVGSVAGGLMYAAWNSGQEKCDDTWIKFNYSGLVSTFKRSLHGQHLAERVIVKVLKGHLQNRNPEKPLVMAFHGTTGSGKNFVSRIIAEHLYVKGMDSQFVHLYTGSSDFLHEREVPKYKDKLQHEIKSFTQLCSRSLFIFDEIDKMPAGVLDSIKPYLDYYNSVHNVDYRKNIFIFLSNAGGSELLKIALKFWTNGKQRDEISMKDIEPIINKGAFNEKGGLQHSSLITRHLIDVYVPFIPLEKKHIEECIRDELRARFLHVDENVVRSVSNQVEYLPENLELYSESGCKRLKQKIDIYAD